MTDEQLEQVIEIFDVASDLYGTKREEYLSAACGSDGELRAEVERLLVRHDQAGDFLEEPALPDVNQQVAGLIGRQIGPYKLSRELGSGGMGVVYLAVRTDEVYRKEVAVKFVWPGLQHGSLVRRFHRERQILAHLDHPNIARLLDGGVTEDGLPYLIMEYVNGQPITEYCDARRLNITERLKLFCTVCAAVEYAHRNLIVHRDLKPANIFVTDEGTVKLLDFGIAKLLDPESEQDSTLTGLHPRTPEYASPEQVLGDVITTASDVYSLGVVLYELLAGHRPYPLKKITPLELERAIAETEPEPLSAAIRRVVPPTGVEGGVRAVRSPEQVSASREGSLDKLRRRLAGDLDNIVLMALRKEPEHRYRSATQLSEDIANHLASRPLIARTSTVAYRVNKFVRRNKLSVAFASFVALTLIAIVSFVVWQWRAGLAQARETHRELYAARMNRAVQDREDFNLPAIRETVASFSPRPGKEDLRGFEWYYLWRWCNRDLLTLQHDQAIEGANVIENSPLVLTSALFDSYWMHYIWNGETGKLLHVLPGFGAANPVLDFAPAGFAVQQSGKQAFRVWQLGTGKEVTPAVDTLSPIASSLSSCDNFLDYRSCQLFTVGEEGIIRGWNVANGALLCTIKTAAPVTLQSLSLKHQRLALSAGGNRLEFWDLAAHRLVRAVDEPIPITAADLEASPNFPGGGGLLYVGDGVLKRFDWLTGQELQKIAMEKTLGKGLVTHGGKFFSFVGSSEVQIADLMTGRHLGELKGHTGWVRFVDLNPDESVAVTASADHTIRLWDFQTHRQLAVIPAHEREVYQARFLGDGSRLITVGADHTAKIWDVASLLAPDTLEGHTREIFSVAFSPDSHRMASAGRDHTVKLWDVRTGKPLITLEGHKHDIFTIAFSPSGDRLASASQDKTVRLWDVNTGQQVAERNDFPVRPRAVAFSPDGKLLAVGCDYFDFDHHAHDRSIRILDAATLQEMMVIKGHRGDFVAIDFSPDGKRLASASWDNTARVWEVASGHELVQFTGHKEHVWSLRFSPDGHRIATGSTDQTIRIWDAATGRELLPPLTGHGRDIFGLTFSPDGRRLASASSDGTVKLWDAATGRELVTFKDHRDEVWSVAFSPDGRTLASGSWDKTVRLWRAATEADVRARTGK